MAERKDPLGHETEIRLETMGRPDGGESRVVFGVPGTIATPDVTTPESFEPTPWEQYTYDANDNGGRTNISDVAESGFSGHFDTPTSVLQDARGRAIETTERNGPTASDWHTTQTDYDIRGNVTKVIDARGNVAAEQVFDLADQTIRTESIDAGHSTAVFDAAGTSIEARDAKGGLTLKAADDLLRPTKVWARDTDGSGEDVRLVEETLYGDGPDGPSSPADTNHLGKPYRAYDEAGRVETAAYDFKGNVVETTRRVIDPQLMIDAYQAADSSNNWSVDTYRVDWTRQSGETRGDKEAELLKAQDYTTTKAYDGLDRSRQVTYPEDKNGSRKVLEPTYNKAGSLQAVDLDGSTYVEHIAYNPKGQRILAALGCGVMTRYDYDDESMRLVRLRSEGYTKPDSTTYAPDGTTPHQDFSYTYDGVGNVTQIDSSGNNVGIGGTNSLTRTFEYDPLYQLTEATGREYAANPSNPWDYMPAGGNANDPNQTRAYTEEYDYDKVGNMKTLTHDYGAGSGTWTRDYVTESTTNRLDQMTSAGGTHQYTYDNAGNLRTENTDRKYEWDARGRMRSFRNQVSGSQATVFAHYTYDGGGQRVQKVVSKDSGKPVHSVYIGGIFEHHERIDAGSVAAEVNHLHVMDDQKRVAIERIGSELDGSNPPTTQYHLGDHLQSSNVVLDGTGTLFNREEYRPCGESSFGSYATKRYRFTGQERDEESSLSYHGARYYAPWTAQWTSPDPKGMVDGTNLYGYSRNNPVNRTDTGGMQSTSKKEDSTESSKTSSADSKMHWENTGVLVLKDEDVTGALSDAYGKQGEDWRYAPASESERKSAEPLVKNRGNTEDVRRLQVNSEASADEKPQLAVLQNLAENTSEQVALLQTGLAEYRYQGDESAASFPGFFAPTTSQLREIHGKHFEEADEFVSLSNDLAGIYLSTGSVRKVTSDAPLSEDLKHEIWHLNLAVHGLPTRHSDWGGGSRNAKSAEEKIGPVHQILKGDRQLSRALNFTSSVENLIKVLDRIRKQGKGFKATKDGVQQQIFHEAVMRKVFEP